MREEQIRQRAETTATLRDMRRMASQQENEHGHRHDCVCATCFEAWRVQYRAGLYALGRAVRMLHGLPV